jgi:two-component system chemotaxis response regulator CheY
VILKGEKMKKVLIVDDNQNNRLALELLLEDIEDINISEAKNGLEALKLCHKKDFDLIFMDIMMPVMNGIEATKKIKEFTKKPMIIALSALDDTKSKQNMIQNGAEDYMTKPIDSSLFLQRMNNYINIINLRKKTIVNTNALNPFSKSIYDRLLTFNIKTENSLVQFWDYFLRDNIYDYTDLSDYIRIIYGLGLWMTNNNKRFSISIEESESKLFIILNDIGFIKESIVLNIIRKHLPEALFVVENGNLSFELAKNIKITEEIEDLEKNYTNEQMSLNDDTARILTKTHIDNPTAVEYVENTAISILPKLENLEQIEDELDNVIIAFENNPCKKSAEEICEVFEQYYAVISLLDEFEHLIFAVKSLINFIRTIDEENFKDNKIKILVSMLLNLLQDLSSWRNMIFIKQEARDIHYLDASLLSSCLQIQAIFEEANIDEGDDLEFF